ATAIGLLAAIPAVIAYNKLSSDANNIAARMEGFADEFSAILSRQIDEKVAPKSRAEEFAYWECPFHAGSLGAAVGAEGARSLCLKSTSRPSSTSCWCF